jgi:pimeloyl-ACP methyl ester carboxylesterase
VWRLADGARQRRQVWESRAEARSKWAGKDMFAGWTRRALDLYLAEGLRDRSDGRVELKCSGEVEATIFESGSSVDVMAGAPRLQTPTLVLWARRGDFPRQHFEELAARMQRGRVGDADTGHFVPMEDPELVAREALAFQEPDPVARVAQPPP